MVENIAEIHSAEEYWRLGGTLDKDSVQAATKVLTELKQGEKPTVRNSSLVQAEQMEKFSNVPLTEEQKYVYAVLREITIPEKPSKETPKEEPAWKFGDQPLLAEVYKVTSDIVDSISFMAAYPNIFEKK